MRIMGDKLFLREQKVRIFIFLNKWKSRPQKTPTDRKTFLEHRESNPGRQSDSLECYPYTMPDLLSWIRINNFNCGGATFWAYRACGQQGVSVAYIEVCNTHDDMKRYLFQRLVEFLDWYSTTDFIILAVAHSWTYLTGIFRGSLMGEYAVRYHANGNGAFMREACSFYSELQFVISEEDDSVYAKYSQVSQAKWRSDDNNSWRCCPFSLMHHRKTRRLTIITTIIMSTPLPPALASSPLPHRRSSPSWPFSSL